MQASTNSEIFNVKARAKQAKVFNYSSKQVNSKKTMVPFSCQSHDHGSLGAFGLLDFVMCLLANHWFLTMCFFYYHLQRHHVGSFHVNHNDSWAFMLTIIYFQYYCINFSYGVKSMFDF